MAIATTTRKTATRTTANARRTDTSRAAKVEPVAEPDNDTTDDSTVPQGRALRKKELIDRVVAASGKKKKDVKPVVEAMLDVLGASLAAGETMNLQPFGKLTVNRRKDAGNGEVLVAKIRRSTQALDADQETLADPGE